MENLKIDREFEMLIPALTVDEYEQLKSNILSDGEIFNPIFTWNGYIIDGHHRYHILSEHPELKYKIVEKEFSSRFEVLSWICNNQLGRRNLTPENKKYLIGKRYEAEKMSHGGARRGAEFSTDQNSQLKNGMTTRQKIAEETKTSEGYIARAERFAKGVDAAEESIPGIKEEILSGKIKKPEGVIANIAKAPEKERKSLTENLIFGKTYKNPTPDVIPTIRAMGAKMRDLDTPVDVECFLESLECDVEDHIVSYRFTFFHNPKLLSSEYFQRTMAIMQKMVDYIASIKPEERDDSEH